MVTTQDEIYRRVQSAIVDAMAVTDSLAESKVQVVTEENPDLASNLFVQIRPAGGSMQTPRVGSQVVDDRIEVTTWIRRLKDPAGKATLAVAGEDASLFARIENVRSPLRNSWLDGALEVPLRQVVHGSPLRSPVSPAYFRCRDVWACSYELSSDVAFMLFSNTAPTTLSGTTGAPREASLSLSRVSTTASYVWALVPQSVGEVLFWSDGGAVDFYSDLDLPPSGPTCSTATIGGVVYRQWRSPYQTASTSATYRVRGA